MAGNSHAQERKCYPINATGLDVMKSNEAVEKTHEGFTDPFFGGPATLPKRVNVEQCAIFDAEFRTLPR
jgi:hypothetical protein